MEKKMKSFRHSVTIIYVIIGMLQILKLKPEIKKKFKIHLPEFIDWRTFSLLNGIQEEISGCQGCGKGERTISSEPSLGP